MRKTIFTVVILALAWLGYTVWPLYDIFVLVRAFETRNLETLKQRVYFDSVRRSLSDQIVVAYIQRSGIQLPSLARAVPGAALAIADPVVAKVISPEALSEFLTTGWPVAVDPRRGWPRGRGSRYGASMIAATIASPTTTAAATK